jgi:hypothetical protein
VLDTEHLKGGIAHWHDNGKMDALMEFLVRYVRHVHSDRYHQNLLTENPGATFLDVITPSDIAYVIALMENGKNMWTTPKDDDGNKVKPLFTSGENMKRTYGMNIWNEDCMDFYDAAYMFWHAAFNSSCEHYKILSKYWDRWIVRNGKTLLIGKSEHSKKSAYSVLATRDAAEVARRAKRAIRPVVEFKYDSEDDGGNICAGNWGATVRSTSRQGSSAHKELDEHVSESEDEHEEDKHEEDEHASSSSSSEYEGISTRNGKRSGHEQLGASNKRRG